MRRTRIILTIALVLGVVFVSAMASLTKTVTRGETDVMHGRHVRGTK